MRILVFSMNLRSLLTHTATYTFGNILTGLIPFLLMPVLTRYLTREDYGVTATFSTLFGLGASIIGLNLQGAIARYYFELDSKETARFAGTATLFTLGWTLLVLIAVGYNIELFIRLTELPPAAWPYLTIALLANYFYVLRLTFWQVEKKATSYVMASISLAAIIMSSAVLFVVWLDWGWLGRVRAQFAGFVLLGLFSLHSLLKGRKLSFSWNSNYLKKGLYFGLPLLPHSMAGWAMSSIDRLFLNNYTGLAATGIYSAGYAFGQIIDMLCSSFNNAWVPHFYESLSGEKNDTREKLARITLIYNASVVYLAMLLGLLAPCYLSFYVGKEFTASSPVVIWIALAYAAGGMYKMVGNYLFYAKKTHLVAAATFSSASLGIFLNFIFIPVYGIKGAALSTFLTFTSSYLLTFYLSARVFTMPWGFKHLLPLILAIPSCFIVSEGHIMRLGYLILYPLLLFALLKKDLSSLSGTEEMRKQSSEH